jgi:hypothetical protein
MPSPTVRDVHLETALSNLSVAYRNGVYIAEDVFPRLTVSKKSDYYFIFDKQAWFMNQEAIRAPGTRAQRVDYTLSTASYVCLGYALAKTIPDEVRENADNPLRPDVEATEFVTDALIRAQEIRVAALITGSLNWAYSSSPTTQWTNDLSDPLADIEAAVDGVISRIGRVPNVAVMSWAVWRYLKNHPDLLERIKYTRANGRVEPTDLGSWFGLNKILIGTAVYDTALEGQTASMTYIWGDDFWVGYVPPTPALMAPAAGYVFEWETRKVARFREDQERQDVIEASHSVAEKITASDAGAIIYDVT